MKKHLKLILLFICLFKSNDVYASVNPYNPTGPYGTNCTWYAWNMAYEKKGVTLPGWGNAKDWYNDASNAGYSVGTTPKAGSIIVWGGWTSYGHVGYVESVSDNILHVWDSTGPCIDREDPEYISCIENGVSEETDKICNANAKRIACEYTISPDDYGITGYIYLDYIPQVQVPSVNVDISKEEDKKVEAIPKSNNAYLSEINISNINIQFDKEVTNYNIEVDYEIENISVNAISEDSKSTISGLDDYVLNIGLNTIKLLVIAEDATTKEYVINITRKEKLEHEINDEDNQVSEKVNENVDKVTKKNDDKMINMIIITIISSLVGLVILFTICRKIYLSKNFNN